jgi:hypothetical protein
LVISTDWFAFEKISNEYTIMNGNQTIKKIHGHFKEGFYQAAVRPCFGNTCLPPIWSKGVKIEYILTDTALMETSGRIDEYHLRTAVFIVSTNWTYTNFIMSDKISVSTWK